MYSPPRRNSSGHLTIQYAGHSRNQSLWIRESAQALDAEDYEWEELEVDGRRLRLSDPGPGKGSRIVALEQEGTHAQVHSHMDRDRILKLAASLVRATRK
jgi:hypothetical protein